MNSQQVQPSEHRPSAFWWGLLLFVLGALIGAGTIDWLRTPRADNQTLAATATSRPLDVLGQVSDFVLTERSGKVVTLESLAGTVWVADFMFTSCTTICPMMSTRMQQLQDRTKNLSGVKLVSISVDPEVDTPERLARYATRYNADPDRWWFLTGDKKEIYELSRASFLLSVMAVSEKDRAPGVDAVTHSRKFVLMDKQSRIRGYYDGEIAQSVDALARDIKRLLDE